MSRYRAGVPAAIGKIAWLARVLGRARQDHVEERARRECREEVAANGVDAVAETVGPRVLGGIERGVRIDVGRDDVFGPARAAASARMPVPVPISTTFLPLRSRPPMNSAKRSLLMKSAGETLSGARSGESRPPA